MFGCQFFCKGEVNKKNGTNLSSASFIHLSKTGLIFWALFGVMSNFSNLQQTNSPDENSICVNFDFATAFGTGH
jgi:hypothetical protein